MARDRSQVGRTPAFLAVFVNSGKQRAYNVVETGESIIPKAAGRPTLPTKIGASMGKGLCRKSERSLPRGCLPLQKKTMIRTQRKRLSKHRRGTFGVGDAY